MASASWNGKTLALSDDVEVVEGNSYFPPDSIMWEHFQESNTETICPRKGTAHFYHIKVEGQVNVDAAWTYHEPKDAAKPIKNFVAFWRGVEVKG